jgi:hypothetical protein
MKKLLAFTLSVLSVGFAASIEARSTTLSETTITGTPAELQIRVQIGNNNRRRSRRVIRTRSVSPNGRRVVTRTYRPNGRVVTRKRVIRRTRNY